MPSSFRNNNDSLSVTVAATLGAMSCFAGGLLCASYALRLRDRERLRQACSRIQKHLVQSQRTALGPVHMKLMKKKETILVVGAGAYGTYCMLSWLASIYFF